MTQADEFEPVVLAVAQVDHGRHGQLRHEQGQPGLDRLDDRTALHQGRAGLGEQRDPGGGLLRFVLRLAPGGHVVDEHRDPVGDRLHGDLDPAAEPGGAQLRVGRILARHDVAEQGGDRRVRQLRHEIPHPAAHRFAASGDQDAGRLIGVAHGPVGVDRRVGGGHGVQRPSGLLAVGVHARAVEDGAEHAALRGPARRAGPAPGRSASGWRRPHRSRGSRPQIATGVDGLDGGFLQRRSISRNDPPGEPRQGWLVVSVDAEERLHAVVPHDLVGEQIPVESADGGGVHGQLEPQGHRIAWRNSSDGWRGCCGEGILEASISLPGTSILWVVSLPHRVARRQPERAAPLSVTVMSSLTGRWGFSRACRAWVSASRSIRCTR